MDPKIPTAAAWMWAAGGGVMAARARDAGSTIEGALAVGVRATAAWNLAILVKHGA